jgi:hypothetical protein
MKTSTRKRRAAKNARRSSSTSAARYLQDNAGSALRSGRNTLSRAYDWAHEAAGNTRLGSLRMPRMPRMPRRTDMMQLAEANPLLLGAVGLGLGVAIGTLFPRSLGFRSSARTRRGRRPNSDAVASTRTGTRRRRKSRTRSAKARTASAAAAG